MEEVEGPSRAMPSSGPAEPESHEGPQGEIPADDGQRIKLVQQGDIDTERSLTQLGKVDVTPGPQETAWHDKPQGVCCVIRPQHIEIYAKPMPVVSEWFNPGTEHYWHTNFVVPREDCSTINWYRALGWAKTAWPLPPLENLIGGGGSRPTEPGLELNAKDLGPADVDRNVLVKRQMREGDTRACVHLRWETWFPDLVLAVEWIAANEWAAKIRKDISHIGGHFSDWITTELWAMAGRTSLYLVVKNGTYSMLFDHVLTEFKGACTPLAQA